MRRLFLCALAATMAMAAPALAQTTPEPVDGAPPPQTDAPPRSTFKPILSHLIGGDPYLYFSAAPEWTFWEPGINTNQARILDFTGQGFTGVRFSGGIGIGDEPLTFFNYSRPFTRTVDQAHVIESGGKSGFESLQLAARIGGFIGFVSFLDQTNPVLQTIASTSVSYTNETFVGTATAYTDAKMLNFGATLVPNGRGGYAIANPAQAITSVNSGTSYKFRTEFKDFEASVDIAPLLGGRSDDTKDLEFRIGGYWSEWSRPAEIGSGVTFTSLGRTYPVVHQAKYRTKGVLVRFGDRSPNRGLDFSVGLRVGIDDDIETAFPGLLESSNPLFLGFQAKLGYNFLLTSGSSHEIYLSPFASLDYRNFMETTKDVNGNILISDKILDGEKIYKLYLRLWAKF